MTRYSELLSSQQSPAEMHATSLPESVKAALRVAFKMPISGYLCCAQLDPELGCLVGIVYRESRGRFRDGATIRTSTLLSRHEHPPYLLFETVNGSLYVVCNWAQEGGSPRCSGVKH
jgi:hypothetical protein